MMRIGSIALINPLILAPLAGITDLPFRLLAREQGCALVYSEMVSANGLVYNSGKTRRMLASDPAEKPLAIQIFGADPAIMARAAGEVAASGADIIDINFGCSVKKILKSGAGSALMKSPERAEAIIRAVRGAAAIPLTIKIRSGWDPSGEDAFRMLAIAEKCGVDAITLHPRTARQGFTGKADWRLIAELKKRSSIPVIGNGDIKNAADVKAMMEETGCDAVMIGRAAVGNPWIFSEVLAGLAGQAAPPVSIAGRFAVMERYLSAAVDHYGEPTACRMMRSHLGWFVKGLPSSSHFRESIKQLAGREEGERLLHDYREFLLSREEDRGQDLTGLPGQTG